MKEQLTSPEKAFRFFAKRMNTEVEEFWVAALNAEKTVVAAVCLFRGTVDACFFHPRDVFRFGLLHNASSLVAAHNHPSGNSGPSAEDAAITAQMMSAGDLLNVPIVDHLVIGKSSFYSFRMRGQIKVIARDPVPLSYPEPAKY